MNTSKARQLGDVADFLSGFAWKAKQFSDDPNGMPIIRIQNVGSNASTDFKYWPDTFADRFIISEGDLLLTLSGSFRTAVWSGPNALLNQRIVKVTPKANTDTRWLFYALEDAMARIANMGRHALVSNVALSDLKELKINVPPLEEQKRIAEILDQADALRRLRFRALEKLNTLGQAIFHEMFGNDFGTFWSIPTTLDQVTTKISDGTHHSPPIVESGIPYVTAKHLKKHGLDFDSNPWYISKANHDPIFSRCNPEMGDVLYIKDGATTGLAAVNKYDFAFSMLSSLALLKPKPNVVLSDYLCFWLNSDLFRSYALGAMSGAGITRLTLRKIKELPIHLPSVADQELFVSKTSVIFEGQEVMRKELRVLASLFASLQQRAFRGEL